MPVDAQLKIVYGKFKEVVYAVKYTTIKNAIVEAQASDTEKLLLDMCREQERLKWQHEFRSGGGGGGVSGYSQEEPTYVGMITAKQLQTVLSSVKIGLGRLQITSVMSDACMLDSMVDYWKFVPVAAKTIEKMLDPTTMDLKIELLSKGLLSQDRCFNGKSEAEIAQELNALFDLYDEDSSGQLDPDEFHHCLESLALGLTRGNIDALLASADEDGSSLVDRREFMNFTFRHLVHLMKERQMSLLQHQLEQHSAEEVEDAAKKTLNARRRGASKGSPQSSQGSKGDHAPKAPAEGPAAASRASAAAAAPGAAPSSYDVMFSQLVDPSWDEATLKEHRELMDMFWRADANHEGCLNELEFHRLLEALDLGLTPYQMARLMAEADENEDGSISYTEFLPVMMRFMQTYKTKKVASKQWSQRELLASAQADSQQGALRHELAQSVRIIEHAFREAHALELQQQAASDATGETHTPLVHVPLPAHAYDTRVYATTHTLSREREPRKGPHTLSLSPMAQASLHPRLSRQNFLRCLALPHAHLPRQMISMVRIPECFLGTYLGTYLRPYL